MIVKRQDNYKNKLATATGHIKDDVFRCLSAHWAIGTWAKHKQYYEHTSFTSNFPISGLSFELIENH